MSLSLSFPLTTWSHVSLGAYWSFSCARSPRVGPSPPPSTPSEPCAHGGCSSAVPPAGSASTTSASPSPPVGSITLTGLTTGCPPAPRCANCGSHGERPKALTCFGKLSWCLGGASSSLACPGVSSGCGDGTTLGSGVSMLLASAAKHEPPSPSFAAAHTAASISASVPRPRYICTSARSNSCEKCASPITTFSVTVEPSSTPYGSAASSSGTTESACMMNWPPPCTADTRWPGSSQSSFPLPTTVVFLCRKRRHGLPALTTTSSVLVLGLSLSSSDSSHV
mmetsp:Transcript_6930/g.24481  ORF Transcript_6930/g.24481 Transcript_6930/m.24481 type:complete len:281 (+) Transcript_6930:4161-5003(+)